jgi:hypothetical protein
MSPSPFFSFHFQIQNQTVPIYLHVCMFEYVLRGDVRRQTYLIYVVLFVCDFPGVLMVVCS